MTWAAPSARVRHPDDVVAVGLAPGVDVEGRAAGGLPLRRDVDEVGVAARAAQRSSPEPGRVADHDDPESATGCRRRRTMPTPGLSKLRYSSVVQNVATSRSVAEPHRRPDARSRRRTGRSRRPPRTRHGRRIAEPRESGHAPLEDHLEDEQIADQNDRGEQEHARDAQPGRRGGATCVRGSSARVARHRPALGSQGEAAGRAPGRRCRRPGSRAAARAPRSRHASSAAASASIERSGPAAAWPSPARRPRPRAPSTSGRQGPNARHRVADVPHGDRHQRCRRSTAARRRAARSATTPSEYWSERSSPRSPFACSGERYWPVPSTVPVAVSASSESSARAIPKSVTFAVRLRRAGRCAASRPGGRSRARWANASARRDLAGELDAPCRPAAGPSRSITDLQVLAGDVLEDDELPPLPLAAIDDGDDVRDGRAARSPGPPAGSAPRTRDRGSSARGGP